MGRGRGGREKEGIEERKSRESKIREREREG